MGGINRVEVAWATSSRCSTAAGCVEVGHEGDRVLVRDNKLGDDSPVLEYTIDEWLDVLAEVAVNGLPADVHPLVRPWPDGPGYCWERNLVHLHFDSAELDAFSAGVKAGEFVPESEVTR